MKSKNAITIAIYTKLNTTISQSRHLLSSKFKNVDISYKYIVDTESSSINEQLTSPSETVLLSDPTISVEDFKAIPNNVKWVQFTWAGIDNLVKRFDPIDYKSFKPHFAITRYGGSFNKGMSDYVVGHIIAMERNFNLAFVNQQKNVWDQGPLYHYRCFSDLTVGVLGAGNIGMDISKDLKNLGARVLALKRTLPEKDHKHPVDKFYTTKELDTFLSSCDYFCNVLPHTAETVDLLSGDKLKNCKERNAGFINIGRGTVINESSILKALEERWIRGCALDVFPIEPLPSSSPLWKAPNCVITPHISGTSFTKENPYNPFVENMERYLLGQELQHKFDWENMY